jgi:hypothetical protein
MRKNINKIEHFDLSFFPNTITGSYDPRIGSSNSPASSQTTSSDSSNPGASAPNPKIYEGFTLRMSKLPADNFGKIIPVMAVDPSTNSITPSIFLDSMDDTGTYNKNTFLKGLNDALTECIKLGDTCYAVVIKDPTDPKVPTSSTGLAYKFELVQKPTPNDKNDDESLLCNPLYYTYLKNKTTNGISNIMPNSIDCDFNSGPVQYEGSSGNNKPKTNTDTSTESPPKDLSYMQMGRVKPKAAPFPWAIVIGVTICVLFIGGGIYYYYNFGPGAPTIPVKKIVKKVVKGGFLTSKFIKKSGGYFFFV